MFAPLRQRFRAMRTDSVLNRRSQLRIETLEDRATPASVSTLPGTTFEGSDGNLIAGPGGTDWGNVADLHIGIDKPTGRRDDSFGQGAKEDIPGPTVVTGSIPNNKSDLTRFYIAYETIGGETFLYMAWQRANTLGTANIDFEFNQSSEPSINGVTPVRTPGDILITFDFAQGGNTVILSLRTWTGSEWSAATNLTAAGYAEGAVNDEAFGPGAVNVTDPITGKLLPPDTFGEAVINLTAAGVFPTDRCFHLGSAFVKSRSSASFQSELKDFIAPIPIEIDNCSSISGTKFNDLDGDGSRDAGEPGLAGWTMYLDANKNGTLDAGEATTTTDANGNYTFTELMPGTYTVREVQKSGWLQTTANPADVVLPMGTDVTGIDFGNFKLITISGQKFNDTDGDAVKDLGEAGLAGWTIFLDANKNGSLDAGEKSTTTDANGNYSFSNLAPGTYTVREAQQTGWIQTTANPVDIVARSGVDHLGVDFGNQRLMKISGQKFNDLDGDGIKEAGESGLGGWTIFLDANGNNALDAGERSTVTDATGNYTFDNLKPGTYTVREVQQTGWIQTTANPAPVALVSGDRSGVDFGNFKLIKISGQKYNDLDADGVKDSGEAGLAGWTIYLDANKNGVLDAGEKSTTTDANGNYSFENLGPGTYTVREVQQTGWEQTSANPADIAAASGVNRTNVDFGNHRFTGLIAPTQTTCEDYLNGTASELTGAHYSVSNGVISQAAPGVFFYFSKVTATGGNQTITVTQSNTVSSAYNFTPQNIQLLDANCNVVKNVSISVSSDGQVTIRAKGLTAGQTYVVSVKYSLNSIVGLSAPTSALSYTFTTSLNGKKVDQNVNSLTLVEKTA